MTGPAYDAAPSPGTSPRPDRPGADGPASPRHTDGLARPRRRVAFVIRDLNIGGAQRQLIELASGMDPAEWHVTVFIWYGGGALEGDLRARGVSVHLLDKHGRWDVVGFWYRMLRALRRDRPEIVHSYLGTENILVVTVKPYLRGARVVWGIRGSYMDLRLYGWLPRLLFRVGCWLSRFTDLCISNSAAGRDYYASEGYPGDRIVVVPNGIDSQRFRPDPIARAAVRAEWGIADDQVLVGIVARLDPKKDHAGFLRAAAAVAAERPEARFVVVGDGPSRYRASLVELASELGLDDRLVWAGARLDMPRVYNGLDLIVSSSSWGEGFPNVVAEAMSSEVPCLVTDAGDSTLVAGDTGWVCHAEDLDDLVRVLRAATAEREQLREHGRRARRRIVEEFSTDRLVRTTSGHLRALADRGR